MALKGGRIFQEMVEVPDADKGGGCGCLLWIILAIGGISLAIFVIDFIFLHFWATLFFVIVLIILIVLIKRGR